MPLPQLLGVAGDPWSPTNLSSIFARTSLYVSNLPLLSLTRTPYIQNDLIMKSIITTAKTIFPNKFISTGTWMKTWTCLSGGHNSTHCRIQDLGGSDTVSGRDGREADAQVAHPGLLWESLELRFPPGEREEVASVNFGVRLHAPRRPCWPCSLHSPALTKPIAVSPFSEVSHPMPSVVL